MGAAIISQDLEETRVLNLEKARSDFKEITGTHRLTDPDTIAGIAQRLTPKALARKGIRPQELDEMATLNAKEIIDKIKASVDRLILSSFQDNFEVFVKLTSTDNYKRYISGTNGLNPKSLTRWGIRPEQLDPTGQSSAKDIWDAIKTSYHRLALISTLKQTRTKASYGLLSQIDIYPLFEAANAVEDVSLARTTPEEIRGFQDIAEIRAQKKQRAAYKTMQIALGIIPTGNINDPRMTGSSRFITLNPNYPTFPKNILQPANASPL